VFLSYSLSGGRRNAMGERPFDRQTWAVLLLGWAVALWITLT
jgi:hypothetical protein